MMLVKLYIRIIYVLYCRMSRENTYTITQDAGRMEIDICRMKVDLTYEGYSVWHWNVL